MDLTIFPGKLSGTLTAIPSKSQAHRYLICAAFADKPTELICQQTNQDIEATAACLQALGANIARTDRSYLIEPVRVLPETATLPCGESGSTLRFLLPVVGALGIPATFVTQGRLSQRPLSPLWEEMERMGCNLHWQNSNSLSLTGKLHPGIYSIDGSVSSQFISGLLFAGALMEGRTEIHIQGKLESAPYVAMTMQAMALFGVDTRNLLVRGVGKFHTPEFVVTEGDWSNAAFFLAANMLGSDVDVINLRFDSIQGDRAVAGLIPALAQRVQIDCSNIPDLVPILAVLAGANRGAVFTGIRRLRLKESDRVASVLSMVEALGGKGASTEDTLTIQGNGFTGGTVDACNDHRIAMAAAIAATVCKENVTVIGADAVNKSYPHFWDDYRALGGNYEQHIR